MNSNVGLFLLATDALAFAQVSRGAAVVRALRTRRAIQGASAAPATAIPLCELPVRRGQRAPGKYFLYI